MENLAGIVALCTVATVVVLLGLFGLFWWWFTKMPPARTTIDEKVLQEIEQKLAVLGGTATLHLFVLVQGLLATEDDPDMEKVRTTLKRQAEEQTTNNNNNILIYRSAFNAGMVDGVHVCGQRLAKEINLLLDHVSQQNNNNNDNTIQVNLSLVGNSMGGLVARAALADIHWAPPLPSITVVPKVFSTTCSPHLGSLDHGIVSTWPCLLRWPLETVAPFTLGQASRDLFRHKHHTVVQDLATLPKHTQPLKRFAKRIAYANTHHTDTAVSTETAVFLTAGSETVHTRLPPSYIKDFPFVVAAFTTEQRDNDNNDNEDKRNDNDSSTAHINEWMLEHCQKLDNLGWTKVLVDLRPALPKLLPSCCSSKRPQSTTHEQDSLTGPQLRQRYCRREGWYHLPLAHSVLLADDGEFPGDSKIAQRGMPFVEEYCRRLLRDGTMSE